MAYVKAIAGALLAAVLLGTGAAAVDLLRHGVASVPPEDRAIVHAALIAEALNCAAFLALVLVPLGVVLVVVARRRRRRSASGRAA